jgi:cohesin complex subunit SA-1/2
MQRKNFTKHGDIVNTEGMKNAETISSERLEALIQKRSELEENIDEIKNMLTYMFITDFGKTTIFCKLV